MKTLKRTITSISKQISQFGNFQDHSIKEYKHIQLHFKLLLNLDLISTNTYQNNLSKNKLKNIFPSHKLKKELPENKQNNLWLITIHTKKVMKSTTFGIANIFVQKMKKINKQLLPDVTPNLILAIMQLIYSIKKELLITVCFLQGDAAQMVLTVNIIIKYLPFKIVNALIKQKIFLVGPDLVYSDRI